MHFHQIRFVLNRDSQRIDQHAHQIAKDLCGEPHFAHRVVVTTTPKNIEQFTVRIRDEAQRAVVSAEMQTLGLKSGNEYFHHLYQHRADMSVPDTPTANELPHTLAAIERALADIAPKLANPILSQTLASVRDQNVMLQKIADQYATTRRLLRILAVVGISVTLGCGSLILTIAIARIQTP